MEIIKFRKTKSVRGWAEELFGHEGAGRIMDACAFCAHKPSNGLQNPIIHPEVAQMLMDMGLDVDTVAGHSMTS